VTEGIKYYVSCIIVNKIEKKRVWDEVERDVANKNLTLA
jgi:hypothetical protein